MDNKEYLNEEKYQKTNKKVNKVGLIMAIIGGIMIAIALFLVISGFLGFGKSGSMSSFGSFVIGGFMLVIGFGLASFGGQILFIGHRREITAYMTQQGMPIAQEGIDKMAPTIGKAAGTIAKGIKEGLKDDDKE